MKSKEDSKINVFDNFYKPYELIAFHELFYFNTLSTNRVTNNSATLGFGSNIKALLTGKRNSNSQAIMPSNNKDYKLNNLLLNNPSSDENSADDSYTYVSMPELPSKPIGLKEVKIIIFFNIINQNNQFFLIKRKSKLSNKNERFRLI